MTTAVAVFINPGRKRGAALRHLLGHKGAPWLAHIDDGFARADDGRREGLDTRFFVALVDDEPVANVTLWDNGVAGLVGHVYTTPEHRGRGLAGRLFDALANDVLRRGVAVLSLNVDPDSFQQRFYASRGFVPVEGVAGAMQWVRRAETASNDSMEASVFRWSDWPDLNRVSLSSACCGWRGLGLEGRGSLEYPLLEWAFPQSGSSPGAIMVLRQAGRAVGWVSLIRPRDTMGECLWLDAAFPDDALVSARRAATTLLSGGCQEGKWEAWGRAAGRLCGEKES